MKTMTVDDMKANLDAVLDDVEAGERVEIRRDSRRIATIHPDPDASPASTRLNEVEIAQLLGEMAEFAKGNRLDGLTIREIIDEGRAEVIEYPVPAFRRGWCGEEVREVGRVILSQQTFAFARRVDPLMVCLARYSGVCYENCQHSMSTDSLQLPPFYSLSRIL